MREEQFQHVVLKYLREKGYRGAEQAFRQESRVQTLDEMALSRAIGEGHVGSVSNAVYLYGTADSDPARYPESFRRLRDWVDSSLDLYKNELSRVLYPVFVNCYLELVSKGQSKLALQMMEDEKEGLLARNTVSLNKYSNELLDLQRVSLPEDLQTNDTAKRIRAKTRVNMCQYSYELLKGFLHSSGFMLLLSIVNEFLAIEILPGGPSALEEEEEPEDLAAAVGHSEGELVALNGAEISWGMLETTLEDKIEEVKEEAPAAKKSKKAQPKKKAVEGVGAGAPRVKAAIPLPDASEDHDVAVLADLRKRVRLSGAALPSACLFTFLNTQQGLNTADFTADGARLAGGFADSSVRVYDMDRSSSGGESALSAPYYQRLSGHSGAVYSVHFTHDHSHLLSCGADHTVRLWNMELAANLACYRGHYYPVWDVRGCPAGHYFASGSRDRTARIWSVDRSLPLRILVGHLADVDVVRWHVNCNYVATGSSDKSVRLWDVQTGACVRVLTGHHSGISSLAMSPDGRTVASGGDDGSIFLWDLGSGRRLGALSGHTGSVWSLDYSGDGHVLASGGADNAVGVWDVSGTTCEALDGGAKKGAAAGAAGAAGAGAAAGAAEGGAPGLRTMLRTKSTPVYSVAFTRRNLLLAAGPFINPSAK